MNWYIYTKLLWSTQLKPITKIPIYKIYKELYADIDLWPSLLAAGTDIITVGSDAAVRGDSKDGLYKGLSNGQRYSWSAGDN